MARGEWFSWLGGGGGWASRSERLIMRYGEEDVGYMGKNVRWKGRMVDMRGSGVFARGGRRDLGRKNQKRRWRGACVCVIMGEMMVSTDVSGMMSVNVPKTTDGDHRKEMCVYSILRLLLSLT